MDTIASSSKDSHLLSMEEKEDAVDAEIGKVIPSQNQRGPSLTEIVQASSRSLVEFVAASFRTKSSMTIESFQLIEHKEDPELPWNQRNPDLLVDYLVSFLIFGVGSGLVYISQDEVDSWMTFVAEIFFAAGLIPFVEMLVEIIRRQRSFEVKDIPTIAFIFIALGLYASNGDDSILVITGEIFFATGFIYWIHRAMAFAPHPNDTIRKLEEENTDLKHSVALGLADGYWWNFIEPIARKIANSDGQLMSLEFSTDKESRVTDIPYFLVIVPKTLISDSDNSAHEDHSIIPQLLERCKSDVKYSSCYLPAENQSRQKQFCHVEVATNTNAIFDIPSTLDTIIKQMKQVERTRHELKMNKTQSINKFIGGRCCARQKMDKVQTLQDSYQKEIHFFSTRLAYHLSTSGLEQYVRVVEADIHSPDELYSLIGEISGRFGINDLFSSARTKN